ncbi:MAG: hypothetical protein IAG13_15815 [Deltaproteobacteria bacterium]|nr:hypothetical protein [Nannocystaceae bacterium]
MVDTGISQIPPWDVDGHVVAWSVEAHVSESGWQPVSNIATLTLEAANGVRYCVVLEHPWQAVTGQQMRILPSHPEGRTESAERCLAELPAAAAGEDELNVAKLARERFRRDFDRIVTPNGARVQSVFFAGQTVAISGRFVVRRGSMESFPSYSRGEELPIFLLHEGIIDDLSLDHEWQKLARRRYYLGPAVALGIVTSIYVIAAAVA